MRPVALRFWKYHGLGNDFVVVEGGPLMRPERAVAICDRRRGIGADGLLVLEGEAGPDADFRMHYRNADGGEAEMCGNGGRVLAAFALERGLGSAGRLRFRSRWGTHEARVERRAPRLFQVWLTLPDVPLPAALEAPAPWGRVRGVRVSCGVPHLVIAVADTPAAGLDGVDVAGWGAALRRSAVLGPEGANVDFVAKAPGGELALRTYERGVEGETLACGTGATAAAAAADHLGWARSPVVVRARSGDRLEVSFRRAGDRLADVVLAGPAARVFETDFEPE
jgi:diaminopimelate epimerase